MREHPHRRTKDGRGYACGLCGNEIPDGARVLSRFSAADKLTGVRVVDSDDKTLHECGSKVTDSGEV